MQNPFLVGSKVYLRPLDRADAPQLVSWLNNVEVWSNLALYRPLSLQQEYDFLDSLRQNDSKLTLGLALRETDQLLGAAGLDTLDWKNRSARFGIFIGDKTQWGQGHGREATQLLTDYAFAVLNLHRVWLHVYEYNERGRRAYARVGFVPEGVLRQAHYHDGRYWDVLVMGLLRSDWEARRRTDFQSAQA